MEKERRTKTMVLVTLIVAILGLTVAFATLSQTLTINGTLDFEPYELSVIFQNIDDLNTDGEAEFITEPTISSTNTQIMDYSISLSKPGDAVTFSWEIYNNGGYTAKAVGITAPSVTCTSDTGSEEDEELICGGKEVTMSCDSNSTETGNCGGVLIQTNSLNILYMCGHHETGSNYFLTFDPLEAGATETCSAAIEYRSDVDELPSSNVTISGLGISWEFVNY